MGQIVYADLLFLVNFSMDFLCLFVTARLLCRPFRIWRCALASAMGGVYSVAVLFMGLGTFTGLAVDVGFCAVMCLCAYGLRDKKLGEFLLHTTVFFGVSVGTGGCMTALYSLLNRLDLPLDSVKSNPDGISVWLFGLLALASGLVAMFGGKMFKSISSGTVSTVEITYKGSSVSLKGMTDTGNMLRDPLSGRSVIIVDTEVLGGILSQNCIECALRGDVSGIIFEDPTHMIRLIRMKTASGESLVCAFVPDKTRLTVINKNGKANRRSFEVNAIFAPAKLCFSKDKTALGCDALLPADIIG